MSSPITFSGFNNIDFNSVLNALMTQASQPLTALQTRQTGSAVQVNSLRYPQPASRRCGPRPTARSPADLDAGGPVELHAGQRWPRRPPPSPATTTSSSPNSRARRSRRRPRRSPDAEHDRGRDRRIDHDWRRGGADRRRLHAAGARRRDQRHGRHRRHGRGRAHGREQLPSGADEHPSAGGQRLHHHQRPDGRHGLTFADSRRQRHLGRFGRGQRGVRRPTRRS